MWAMPCPASSPVGLCEVLPSPLQPKCLADGGVGWTWTLMNHLNLNPIWKNDLFLFLFFVAHWLALFLQNCATKRRTRSESLSGSPDLETSFNSLLRNADTVALPRSNGWRAWRNYVFLVWIWEIQKWSRIAEWMCADRPLLERWAFC